MARFDSAIDLADRLIKKNGEQSVLTRKTEGTPPDASKPWEPGPPTLVDTTVSAVWLDEETARVAGFTVKEGEQIVLIPAKELEITPDPATDILVRENGERWTIVSKKTLQPNTQRIMHTVRVRS